MTSCFAGSSLCLEAYNDVDWAWCTYLGMPLLHGNMKNKEYPNSSIEAEYCAMSSTWSSLASKTSCICLSLKTSI